MLARGNLSFHIFDSCQKREKDGTFILYVHFGEKSLCMSQTIKMTKCQINLSTITKKYKFAKFAQRQFFYVYYSKIRQSLLFTLQAYAPMIFIILNDIFETFHNLSFIEITTHFIDVQNIAMDQPFLFNMDFYEFIFHNLKNKYIK